MNRDAMIVDAVIKYVWNVPRRRIFEQVYGTGHPEHYMQDKIDIMLNLIDWWGTLDEERRERLVHAAMKHMKLK